MGCGVGCTGAMDPGVDEECRMPVSYSVLVVAIP
jgi:hypothetical protein